MILNSTPLETPVLYLVFNRPEETKLSFASIRNARPKYLFIAADGARKEKPEEEELCHSVREYILKNIDWDCAVKTLFHKDNLGCGRAPSSAISWFFEQVDMGIIIEDDVVPNHSFYRFHSELLERYKNNKQV